MTRLVDRTKRDRLSALHVAEWRQDYEKLRRQFRSGIINEGELARGLAQLGFRSDAHRIEMLELTKHKINTMGPS
jgi:hypothetical protein